MKKRLSLAIAGAAAIGLMAAGTASATGESGVTNTGQCVADGEIPRAFNYRKGGVIAGPGVNNASGEHGPGYVRGSHQLFTDPDSFRAC